MTDQEQTKSYKLKDLTRQIKANEDQACREARLVDIARQKLNDVPEKPE